MPLEVPNLEDIVLAVWALDSSKPSKRHVSDSLGAPQEPWKIVQVREVQTVKAQKMMLKQLRPVLQFFAKELTESWIWPKAHVGGIL